MAKIQHKRSSVVEGGAAKQPTAAQTEYGELCVNYSTEDPSLFIRDSADNIIKIGTDIENLVDLEYFEDNSNKVFISQTPPADPKNGSLWWSSALAEDGGGRLYVYYDGAWVDTSVPGGGSGDVLTESEANGLYLSKVNNDTAAGEITFEGTTTHENGVSVTGTNTSNRGITTEMIGAQSSQYIGSFALAPSGSDVLSSDNIMGFAASATLNNHTSADTYGFASYLNDSAGTGSYNFYAGGTAPNYFKGITEHESGVKVTGGTASSVLTGFISDSDDAVGLVTVVGDLARSSGTVYAQRTKIDDASCSGNFDTIVLYDSALGSNQDVSFRSFQTGAQNLTGAVPSYIGFEVVSAGASNVLSSTGFRSDVNNNGSLERYNFYAQGNAPNYFAGQIKQGTTTAGAVAGSGVQLNGFVRAWCNETDFPENDLNNPQPFQILSAPSASSTKSVKLSLNASGSAYFAGDIDCDGLINGAFSLRMESDNPAAFTTAYSTDDEGNQVENQTYVGTTESLLDIIRDLRSRLAALEGLNPSLRLNPFLI